MRDSKPAAMCLAESDIEELLDGTIKSYSPIKNGVQLVDEYGYFMTSLNDFRNLIAYIPRIDCESDESYRQLLPYMVIRTLDNKFLAYNRQSKTSSDGEQRLAGKCSIGLGGHIELVDVHSTPSHTLFNACTRELKEEIYITCKTSGAELALSTNFSFIGVIKSCETQVDRVHLGLIYVLDLNKYSFDVTPHSKEPNQVVNPRWVSRRELKDMPNLESWSQKLAEHFAG